MWISKLIYRIFIGFYHGIITFASPFNEKARLFVQGRTTQTIKPFTEKTLWFHCASLGEFEQARPLIEWCYKELDYPIVLTFFSPSGYEYKANFPLAKAVYYLPKDTPRNAISTIKAINPQVAFFIKYEFWFYHLSELRKQNIAHFLVAGLFRKSQLFFKSYGILHKKMLKSFDHCFVQDNTSLQLLREHNFLNSSLALDTRFDAVIKRSETAFSDEIIEEFINGQKTLVVGSSWPKDERIVAEFTKHFKDLKIIIAPHDVNESRIKQLLKTFPQAVLYSNGIDKRAAQILIIDRIGILSLLYRYGDICYIGGGFNKSVHNVLEAAVYGKPLLYGPNHSKSKEAKDLVALNATLVLSGKSGNHKTLAMLMNEDYSNEAGQIAAQYVKERAGGTETIIRYLLEKRFI